jgi:hypothetical protein
MHKIYSSLVLFFLLFANLFQTQAQVPQFTFTNSEVEIIPIKIALVIPFCSKYSKQELVKKKLVSLQEAAIQYYQGIKLAIDSLNKVGFQIQLNIYDTNRDSLETLKILQNKEMKEMDLIIGPFFKEGVEMAIKICNEIKVYHIAPTINVTSPIVSPYFIQPNSEISNYSLELLKYISKADSGSQIIVFTDAKKSTIKFADKIKNLTDSLHISFKRADATNKEINWSSLIASDKKNSIIFPSNNDALVQKVFKSITDTAMGISVYGIESWMGFKNTNFDTWEKFHVSIVSTNYVDYADDDVQAMIKKFHVKFYTEPTEYSFKAFDQLMSIGQGWLANPLDWKQHPEQWSNGNGLISNINYSRDPLNQNVINNSFKILKFENYQLRWVW